MARKTSIRAQTGVLPIIGEGESAQIVLITSRKRKKWILPKGIVEPDMSPKESALKEALEEAGITGKIVSNQPLGSYDVSKSGRKVAVDIYRMAVEQVLESWPEQTMRFRRVVGIRQALDMLSDSPLCDIVRRCFDA